MLIDYPYVSTFYILCGLRVILCVLCDQKNLPTAGYIGHKEHDEPQRTQRGTLNNFRFIYRISQ